MRKAPNTGHARIGAKGAVWTLVLLVLIAPFPSSAEQNSWSPFRGGAAAASAREQPPKQDADSDRRYLPPDSGAAGPTSDEGGQTAASQAPPAVRFGPLGDLNSRVERSELAPIVGAEPATGGAGGNGSEAKSIETLLRGLEVPSSSPALSVLYRRFVAGISGAAPDLLAIKAEALYRAGFLQQGADLLANSRSRAGHAALSAQAARYDVALGRQQQGCEAAKTASARRTELPPPLRADMIALQGYCAAASGNASGAGLAADLAREEGSAEPATLAALDAVALGQKPRTSANAKFGPLAYRLLRLAGASDLSAVVERAHPALLAVVVNASDTEPMLKVAAAEAAARVNIIEPQRLADVYREQRFAPRDLSDPLHARVAPVLRRSLLFQSAEVERNPLRKSRAMRALADDARRSGLYLQVLAMLADQVDSMTPAQEIGWFSETAVEVLLADGRFERAARWAAFGAGLERHGPGSLEHWLALIDVADTRPAWRRGEYLGAVEDLALRGRFSGEALSRLATVLDALDYQVPMRLWEAASKVPQPKSGHLPETGVLSDLQAAANGRDKNRTMVLAIRALGPGAVEGAHMIALGDAIRALKRAGFEGDARRIGFEALFAVWPRSAYN